MTNGVNAKGPGVEGQKGAMASKFVDSNRGGKQEKEGREKRDQLLSLKLVGGGGGGVVNLLGGRRLSWGGVRGKGGGAGRGHNVWVSRGGE